MSNLLDEIDDEEDEIEFLKRKLKNLQEKEEYNLEERIAFLEGEHNQAKSSYYEDYIGRKPVLIQRLVSGNFTQCETCGALEEVNDTQ